MAGLMQALPSTGLVWGGDWNHALAGPEYAGSKAGRAHIHRALTDLRLQVPTAKLANRLPGLLTIDHIGVPESCEVVDARQVDASAGGCRLSDHDMYVVEIAA